MDRLFAILERVLAAAAGAPRLQRLRHQGPPARSATILLMQNDELAEQLDALQREECYRVDSVLKESAAEVTQRVCFMGANGAEQGPFVRKYIEGSCGLGAAYERIFAAQRQGRRFRFVPRIFDCYRLGEKLVVVMEFVDGETLADAVYRRDPSLAFAREVFPSLCDAVSELHEAFDPPLIHRDLKPSNIMVSPGGVTIIDFGIARAYRDDGEADTARFGTRAYAPPEQFGYAQTSVRSDVYALGMLLYYCLAEKTPDARLVQGGFAEACVPAALRPVLVRATAFDPRERYASARELKEAFLEAAPAGAGAASIASSSSAASSPLFASRPAVPQPVPAPQPAVASQPASASQSATPQSAAVSQQQVPASQPVFQPASASAHRPQPAPSSQPQPAPAPRSAAPQPAPAPDAPQSQPAASSASASRLRRVPLWVGVVWDVLLVLLWIALFVASNMTSFMPNEQDASYPLWFRLLEYHGLISVPSAATFYLLLDKRLLRRRIPALAQRTWKRDAVAAFAIIGVSVAIVIFAGQFIVPNGVFVQ